MSNFYFPLLFLTPGFDKDELRCGPFAIARRKWTTTTFDFATLAVDHNLFLPYQLFDVLMQRCSLELCVEAEDKDAAIQAFHTLRLGLYAAGLSPFLSPVVATHSVNAYSGINARDSRLQDKLDDGLKDGWTTVKGKISVWPLEVSLECILLYQHLEVTQHLLQEACDNVESWMTAVKKSKMLSVVRDAASAAPQLRNLDQSLLHLWTAIEALFPNVSQEVSFRIALYLAQMISPKGDRQSTYHRVKTGYNLRSKIAHGSTTPITHEQWLGGWQLLMEAVRAIVARNEMPSEDDLLAELLNQPISDVDGSSGHG